MKFGIQTSIDRIEWQQLEDAWRFFDTQTGYHSAWTYDHFVPPMGDPNGACFEGWTALAALAGATSRINLGCLVSGVTYRNPALLGKMAVTVDHISGGRLTVGIGAAWHEAEHRFFGWEFPPVKERQDRLEEAAQILRAMLSGDDSLDFQGHYYQVNQAPILPSGVQKPIPLMIGGGGEKRTLRSVARYADVMNVSGTAAEVKHKIEVVERHCRDAGRNPAEIEKSIQAVLVVTDNEDLANRVAAGVAGRSGLTPAEARKEYPIGRPEEVREVLKKYQDVGVEHVIHMSQGPWKEEIFKRISDEVIAHFN
ncbi:MAG: TIGR03560 family F420-dependent LLM class oxidoreductase [Dehalococcoidia bacterium]